MYFEDTIVAPITPPGTGAVGIVRLSGPAAFSIVKLIWTPLGGAIPNGAAARVLRLGEIRDPRGGAGIDRAMAVFFPQPKSFTGEDVAELHCHGGAYLIRRVAGLAVAAGARLAERGEFTRRAFLNGRIDLTEAEAIRDLIEARGERALTLALGQLNGALAVRVDGLRGQVLAIRAHLEAEIDFSDEDLKLPSRAQIAAEIEALIEDVAALHATFDRGRIAREGIRAAIIGRPNVGKSSILNLMLGIERAIVTPIPGTTRDVIEDTLQLGGYPVVLQDTAGIREAGDQVERIGIERALERARDADLLIAVFDSSEALQADDFRVMELLANRAGIALLNKSDLPPSASERQFNDRGVTAPIIRFSALRAQGVDELRDAILHQIEAATGEGLTDTVAISRERHREALARAIELLRSARQAALDGMPPEIVAVEVTLASEALTAITGAVDSEDVLDVIFREFCIGK
ncbi:MAG: tRNA uridine-5-carboxymethylaminomethyl(34) synthesis GTPase MnmE [Candidatus Binataceae bacterium]|nr:tRNA uridine-5-carboxymethylaminomethyl(34) synthesis GTPase MnmE [Candidatus Binataceae bacterium]